MVSNVISKINRLKILNSKNINYQNENLYNFLINRDLYFIAYRALKCDRKISMNKKLKFDLEKFNTSLIDQIIDQIQKEKYKFNTLQTVSLNKEAFSQSKSPSLKDLLVQKVLEIILYTIYDPQFSASNCQTNHKSQKPSINKIEEKFKEATWVIQGHIDKPFKTKNVEILLSNLKERINDKKFILFIEKLLCSMYTSNIQKHSTTLIRFHFNLNYCSDIFLHIYFKKVDYYIRKLNGKYLKYDNKTYNEINSKIQYNKRKLQKIKNDKKRLKILKDLKNLQLKKYNCKNIKPKLKPIKFQYTRYLNKWIIGIKECLKYAKLIQKSILKFVKNIQFLTLYTIRTKWEHKKILYLGFNLKKIIDTIEETPLIRKKLPTHEIIKMLYEKRFCNIYGFPKSKRNWTTYDPIKIIYNYNSVLYGFIDYYKLIGKTETIKRLNYILKLSCIKTLAHKYKTSSHKIFNTYYSNNQKSPRLTIPYNRNYITLLLKYPIRRIQWPPIRSKKKCYKKFSYITPNDIYI